MDKIKKQLLNNILSNTDKIDSTHKRFFKYNAVLFEIRKACIIDFMRYKKPSVFHYQLIFNVRGRDEYIELSYAEYVLLTNEVKRSLSDNQELYERVQEIEIKSIIKRK